VSKIETGRYSDLLRRYLGMKGVSAVSSELSPEIAPAFVLESERPEWEFLKNERLMAGVFSVPGVAAQNAVYRLRNPAGSGVVAVFSQFTMGWTNSAAVGLVERDDDNGNLGTILPTVSRDTRLPVLNASSLIASTGNNVTLTGESWWTNREAGDTSRPQRIDFVLTEGNELDFVCITVAISMRGFVHWRERRLDVLETG